MKLAFMSTRTLLMLMVAAILFSCSASRNVPRLSELHTDGFGGDIELTMSNERREVGELLEVGLGSVTIINEKDHVKRIQISEIQSWHLKVADVSKVNNGLLIANAMVVGHGAFRAFSLPINLAMSGALVASLYSYNNLKGKGMDISKAKAFARFPQGIPAGVKDVDLRLRQGAKYY